MIIGVDVRSMLESQPTGVGEYTRNVVRQLIQQGDQHQIKLYASGVRRHRDLVELLESTGATNVQTTWMRWPNKILSLSTTTLNRPSLDERVGGVDVFFSPNINFAAISPGVPHVLTVHDVSFIRFPEFFSTWRRAWHRATKARSLMRSASHVICDSESTAYDVGRYVGVASEHISVVPLAPIHPTSSGDSAAPSLKGPYIAMVGTLEPRKNIAQCIAAFDQLAKKFSALRLVCIGPYGWKQAELRSALKKSAHRNRIILTGFVSEPQRKKLMSGATVVCVPSHYEGFGLPVLEAMRADVPVVTSDVSSLPEVARDYAILTDPERPYELVRALDAVLSDTTLQKQLKNDGTDRVADFSWEQTGQQTLSVLESVVENRSWLAQHGLTAGAR